MAASSVQAEPSETGKKRKMPQLIEKEKQERIRKIFGLICSFFSPCGLSQ